MSKNPNIPYDLYQNGMYVSLFSTGSGHSMMTPLIRTDQYREVETRFQKLSGSARAAVTKIAAVTPPKAGQTVTDPLADMSPSLRDGVIAELRQHGLGWTDAHKKTFGLTADEATIVRDIRDGKPGFNSPVYGVNGSPVVAQHFDEAGNLARGVARAYGVPPGRDDAIAARAGGIRRDLLNAAATAARTAAPTASARGFAPALPKPTSR